MREIELHGGGVAMLSPDLKAGSLELTVIDNEGNAGVVTMTAIAAEQLLNALYCAVQALRPVGAGHAHVCVSCMAKYECGNPVCRE